MMFALAVIIGIFVLGILVFVHELGHFAAAKFCKIKVHVFALGFGKALLKWKRGETEYRINAIPFGGYVAMTDGNSPVGETAGGDSDFNRHPIWKRALVAVAGPFANFVFAVMTLWIVFIIGIDRPAFMDSTKVGVVMPGSPADSAGFKAGDSVISLNGEPAATWEYLVRHLVYRPNGHNVRVARGGAVFDFDLHIENSGARQPKFPTGGLLPKRHPPIIGRVSPKGGANNILFAGDTLLSIMGTPVSSFDHFAFVMRNDYVSQSGPIAIDIKRGDSVMQRFVLPTFDSTASRYLIGIEPIPELKTISRYPTGAAFAPAMKRTWEYTTMIFDVLGRLTSGQVSANELGGPLTIIPVSGLIAFQGLSNILDFMALIGINLAVLNLLPLVITDGGLLVFLLIEAIRGKPLPANAQAAVNKVFIMLFIALFLFISFNDVQRLPDFFRWTR